MQYPTPHSFLRIYILDLLFSDFRVLLYQLQIDSPKYTTHRSHLILPRRIWLTSSPQPGWLVWNPTLALQPGHTPDRDPTR